MPYIPWKPHFDNFLTANSNGPVKRAFKCKMHCSIVKIASLIAYSAINVTATLSRIHNTNDISAYTCTPRNHRIINIVHICARCMSSNIPFFLSDLCIQYTLRSWNIFTVSCPSKFRQTFLETMDRRIEPIYRKTTNHQLYRVFTSHQNCQEDISNGLSKGILIHLSSSTTSSSR